MKSSLSCWMKESVAAYSAVAHRMRSFALRASPHRDLRGLRIHGCLDKANQAHRGEMAAAMREAAAGNVGSAPVVEVHHVPRAAAAAGRGSKLLSRSSPMPTSFAAEVLRSPGRQRPAMAGTGQPRQGVTGGRALKAEVEDVRIARHVLHGNGLPARMNLR